MFVSVESSGVTDISGLTACWGGLLKGSSTVIDIAVLVVFLWCSPAC